MAIRIAGDGGRSDVGVGLGLAAVIIAALVVSIVAAVGLVRSAVGSIVCYIVQAMRWAFDHLKIVAEPSGAAALAALAGPGLPPGPTGVVRRPEREPPGTGGHLVLVTGYQDDQLSFHNPSGHTKEAGMATLPVTTFDRFAARRGIALHV